MARSLLDDVDDAARGVMLLDCEDDDDGRDDRGRLIVTDDQRKAHQIERRRERRSRPAPTRHQE